MLTYRLYEIQSRLVRELKDETETIKFMREKLTGSVEVLSAVMFEYEVEA